MTHNPLAAEWFPLLVSALSPNSHCAARGVVGGGDTIPVMLAGGAISDGGCERLSLRQS